MADIAAVRGIPSAAAGGHAGEVETSLILAARTELVEMAYAEAGYLGPMNRESINELMTKGMTALTNHGILGDGRPAAIEHGFAYRDAIAAALAGWVRERLPDTAAHR